jgi:hypothetical protein
LGLGDQSKFKIETNKTNILNEKKMLNNIDDRMDELYQQAAGGVKRNDPIRGTQEFQDRVKRHFQDNPERHLLVTQKMNLLESVYKDQDLNDLANKDYEILQVKRKVDTKTGKELRYDLGSNDQIIAVSFLKPHKGKPQGKIKRGRRKMIVFEDNCSKIGQIYDSENFSFS